MIPPDAKPLPISSWCFVCGEDNPAGLKTQFYAHGERVWAPLRVEDHHCGYLETVHGGVVTALLDETMGWAASRRFGRMFYTGELTVRFLKPVVRSVPVAAWGEITKLSRRLAITKGGVVDAEGVEYVRGQGKFFPFTAGQTRDVDAMLIYRGGEERPFEDAGGADCGD
jgi:uncharacterized protein (TIGR00369 family)